jgi:hypothetical protein
MSIGPAASPGRIEGGPPLHPAEALSAHFFCGGGACAHQAARERCPGRQVSHYAADPGPMTHSRTDDAGLRDSKDVVRYLEASRSWVYHQAESGRLPCLSIGGLLRFDPETIKRLGQTGRAS